MILRTNRPFRSLWLGQIVSVVGDGVHRIALLWWAGMHGGPKALTVLALCTVVPTVLFGPVGGALADRYDRRVLMVGSNVTAAALCGLLAAVLLGADPGLLVVGVMVALLNTASAFFEPAYAATVPAVVDDADLPSANGMNMANSALGSLAGPMLGGVALAIWHPGWIVAANAATFVWAAVLVAHVRPVRPARPSLGDSEAGASPRRRFAAAFGTVPRDLLGLVALAAVLNMVVAPVPILLVSLVVDRLTMGPVGLGTVQLCFGAGMLLGSIFAARLARGITTPMIAVGLLFTVLGAVPLAMVFVVAVLTGVAVAAANTSLITTFQRQVPAEAHGRVFGVVGAMSEGLRPVGIVLAGPLLALGGVRAAFAVIGALTVGATAFWRLRASAGVPAVAQQQAV
jgi:MFS transporter, DHA3 family, macrolide efflux protein